MTKRAAAASRTNHAGRARPAAGRSLRWLTTLAALTVTTMAFAFTGAAQAATTWGAPATIDTNGGPVLSAACPSTTQCTAINFGGQETTFNPQTGSANAPVNIDGVNLLRAIACVSTTLCTGVDDHGLAVSFNPTNGSVTAGPTLIDPLNTFYGISCAPSQTTQCVGLDRNGNEVTFNPNTLATSGVHQVSTASPAHTERVSCPSTSQCTAVDDTGGEVTFNPTAVTAAAPTLVDNTTPTSNRNLYVVSCPLANQCTAIDNGGNEITFNPANVGTPATVVANIDTTPLYSVSCVDGTHCTAVDNHGNELSFDPTASNPAPTAHQVDTTPNGALHSDTCISTTQCTATDNDGNAVTFNPNGTVTSSASVAANNAITSVSCASSTQCTGVDVAGQTLMFNPTTGTSSGPVQIDLNNVFYGVSCVSATLCSAVDWTGQGFAYNPSSPGTPTAFNLDAGALFGGVSCVAATTQCTGVDFDGNEVTYTAGNNSITGITTHLIDSATPSYLQGVSCPSTGQCTAVDYGGNEITFTLPSGTVSHTVTISSGHSLNGVSCPITTQCTAVDAAGNQITFNPQSGSVPTAHNIDTAALYAVSCSSATLCLAVDGSGRAVEFNPAASTGTLETISGAGPLEAISCTSALQCVAVDNSGHEAQGTAPAPAGVPVNSALPTITGTAALGQTLTEVHGTWTNSPISFSYQWEDCDASGANCTAISGATGQTYVVTAADETHTIRVIETASNGSGTSSPATSTQTAAVPTPAPAAPASSAPPTISGTAKVGKTLTESHGTWSGSPTSYTYQWERCNKSGASCGPITGATGQTYKLTSADVGHTLKVIEIASNAGGPGGAATSVATSVVKPKAPTIATVKLTIKGHKITIHLKASGSTTSYQCALVLKPTGKHHKAPKIKWVHCKATKTYSNLKVGQYTLYVRAIGPGGTGSKSHRVFHIKK